MRGTRLLLGYCLSLFTVALLSCADPSADYQEVQKLQDAAEQTISRSADYDIKMKSCDDAIVSLQRFVEKHKDGEWAIIAQNAILSWQARKAALEQELTTFLDQLYSKLEERAIRESQKAHRVSRIENMTLDDRIKTKEGTNIKVSDTYSVRMRGSLLGSHIFKLTVRVSGSFAMDSGRIVVDESVSIKE